MAATTDATHEGTQHPPVSRRFPPSGRRRTGVLTAMVACMSLLVLHAAPASGTGTWSDRVSGTGAWLDGIAFVDTEHGWIVGADGAILQTADGGNVWTDRSLSDGSALIDVSFAGIANGWIVGEDATVWTSSNMGIDWEEQYPGNSGDWLNSVFAHDIDRVWAVGYDHDDDGLVISTDDGGETWTEHTESVLTDERLQHVWFLDDDHGWIGGENGTLLATSDGGQTWSELEIGSGDWVNAVWFVDDETGWVTAGSDILATTDGGQTWSEQHDGGTDLRGLAFLDADRGWAVGGTAPPGGPGSLILGTTDGGDTWTQEVGDNQEGGLWDLAVAGDETAFAVGHGGGLWQWTAPAPAPTPPPPPADDPEPPAEEPDPGPLAEAPPAATDETDEGAIHRLYLGVLGRVAEPGGLAFWQERLDGGQSLTSIARHFARSSEFESSFGVPDDAEFLTLLYEHVMGRSPDPGGHSYWLGILDDGTVSRAHVILHFTESSEFINRIDET